MKLTHDNLKEFDARLLRAKKAAKKKHKAIADANAGINMWNARNPSQAAKQVHDEPYIPQLTPTGIDISRRLTQDLKGVEPRRLPLTEIADRLTELGPVKGFAQETFRPLYIYYRIFSAGSAHANINVYDAYYQPGATFDHAAAQPTDDSLAMPIRITALYCAAFLVGWVLLDAGLPATVATELRNRYEPEPSGQASWAPGNPQSARQTLLSRAASAGQSLAPRVAWRPAIDKGNYRWRGPTARCGRRHGPAAALPRAGASTHHRRPPPPAVPSRRPPAQRLPPMPGMPGYARHRLLFRPHLGTCAKDRRGSHPRALVGPCQSDHQAD